MDRPATAAVSAPSAPVAVVTGAGDGIGRAVAIRLAGDGTRVVLAERNAELGADAATQITGSGGDALFVHVDVGVRAEVEAMVASAIDQWGSVDVLVNNAWGGGSLSRVEDKTDQALQRAFDVGYSGPRWAMNAVLPGMRERGWGRIVNMCSLNGVNAHMGTLEYNSAKEALRALTRTAAREWAGYGITVNAVCPAARTAPARMLEAALPDMFAEMEAANPMGRLGDPLDDIAPVIAFLASDDARYVTGNTVYVDGGGHINGVPWSPTLP